MCACGLHRLHRLAHGLCVCVAVAHMHAPDAHVRVCAKCALLCCRYVSLYSNLHDFHWKALITRCSTGMRSPSAHECVRRVAMCVRRVCRCARLARMCARAGRACACVPSVHYCAVDMFDSIVICTISLRKL